MDIYLLNFGDSKLIFFLFIKLFNLLIDFIYRMALFCHDPATRFVHILTKGNRAEPFLFPEHLAIMVQDVVDTHPGLTFLKEAAEFHSRYVHTVIARIFYSVNRSWSGKISAAELRRSNLLQVSFYFPSLKL